MNVAAVRGGDAATVKAVDDLASDPVSLLLAAGDLGRQPLVFGPGHEELIGSLPGLLHVGPGVGEESEELSLRGQSSHRSAAALGSPHPVEQPHAPTLARGTSTSMAGRALMP